MLNRILRGDPRKTSRFRDYEGRIPPFIAWLYLPRSVFSTTLFKLTGNRPVSPWLGYRAINRISGFIKPGTRVLEFGSGMSTIWFAQRRVELLSIETDPDWFQRIQDRLAKIPNHQTKLLLEKPPYSNDMLHSRQFDFALIDGEGRDSAISVALQAVRPGGYIYLDNADVQTPSLQKARELLLHAGKVEWFVDFTPTQVFVSTGILVQLT